MDHKARIDLIRAIEDGIRHEKEMAKQRELEVRFRFSPRIFGLCEWWMTLASQGSSC